MAISYKIWDFPNLKIQSQLFHVPGAVFDGGLTSGGARIVSPEPGGRSVLEMKLAYQIGEWDIPFSSWLMSKIAGAIFRVQLINTPQVVLPSAYGGTNTPVPWDGDISWNNSQNWAGDGFYLETTIASLEGSTQLTIDTLAYGEILRHGHVIGNGNNCYIIDDIEYVGSIATITVSPPLRNDIAIGGMIYTKPYFLGSISNGAEVRQAYEASKLGGIQLNRIVFNEVILP